LHFGKGDLAARGLGKPLFYREKSADRIFLLTELKRDSNRNQIKVDREKRDGCGKDRVVQKGAQNSAVSNAKQGITVQKQAIFDLLFFWRDRVYHVRTMCEPGANEVHFPTPSLHSGEGEKDGPTSYAAAPTRNTIRGRDGVKWVDYMLINVDDVDR
jgi:hypothetical protein